MFFFLSLFSANSNSLDLPNMLMESFCLPVQSFFYLNDLLKNEKAVTTYEKWIHDRGSQPRRPWLKKQLTIKKENHVSHSHPHKRQSKHCGKDRIGIYFRHQFELPSHYEAARSIDIRSQTYDFQLFKKEN